MENRQYHHIVLPDSECASFGIIQETSPSRDEFTFMVCSEEQYNEAMRYNVGTVTLWHLASTAPESLMCSVISLEESCAVIETGVKDASANTSYYSRYRLTESRLACLNPDKVAIPLPADSTYREYYPNAHTMEFPGELISPKSVKETIIIMARYLSDSDKDLIQNLWNEIDTWADETENSLPSVLPSLDEEEILPRALLLAVSASKEHPFALIVNCKIYPEDQELFRPALNLCWDKYTAIVKPSLSSMVTADEKKFMELVRSNPDTRTVRRLYYDTLACQHRTRELQQRQGIR